MREIWFYLSKEPLMLKGYDQLSFSEQFYALARQIRPV